MNPRPPLPPFTEEMARQKVQTAVKREKGSPMIVSPQTASPIHAA